MTSSEVRCPGCSTPMVVERSKGIEIDRCPACRGLWFDADELGTSVGKPLPIPAAKGPSSRGCPRCKTALALAQMGRVEVDACTTCTGVYLDAGEFSRLTPVTPPRAGKSARHAEVRGRGAGDAGDAAAITVGILSLFG